MTFHKHLQRLIHKHLSDASWSENAGVVKFIEAVEQTFQNYEQDKVISQRAFDLADLEYQAFNRRLTEEKNQREQGIKTLLGTLSTLEIDIGNDEPINKANLVDVAKYLEKQIKLHKQVEEELKLSRQHDLYLSTIISTIATTTGKLLTSDNIYETLNETFALIGQSIYADRVYYFENDPNTNLLNFKVEWVNFGITHQINNPALQNLPYEGIAIYLTPLLKNKPFQSLTKNIEDRATKERLEQQGIISILLLPIFVKEKFFGFIGLEDCTSERVWTQDELNIFQSFATNLANAFERDNNQSLLKQLSMVAEKTTNGIAITNLDGAVIWANQGYLRMMEISKDNLINKRPRDLFNPNDNEHFEKIEQVNAVDFTIEFQIRTWKGTQKWVRLNNTAVKNEHGKVYQQIEVLIDITIRKKAEEEIRKLLEFQNILIDGTGYAIISSSHPDGLITSFNKGAEEMLGYKAEELVGIVTPTLLHDPGEVMAKAASLSQELGFAVEPGIDVFQIKCRLGLVSSDINEWTYLHKSGTRLTVELAVTVLRDKENNITGYLGIAKDITERKMAEAKIVFQNEMLRANEEELMQNLEELHAAQESLVNSNKKLLEAKELAESANRAKSDFLANMSHEIRTPLNGVIGFSDLLLGTDLDSVQRQYMTTVNKSAHTLLDVINDILDFSKIEAGKLELVTEKVDLLTLCNQAMDVISFQAQHKHIDLMLNVGKEVPRFILADAIRLRQVLVNLMGNAIKFTESGEIELKVELAIGSQLQVPNMDDISKGQPETGKRQPQFRFSVRDTGIGIDPINQMKIFEAFSQGDSYTTKKFGGTGLGLAISNKLLALMGGQLQLRSEPGVGSTFFFEISLAALDQQTTSIVKPQVSEKSKKELDSIVISNKPIKILIAEDNAVNMTLTKIIIKKFMPAATFFEAANGKTAVEQFSLNNPDVILMDVQMPEMNGYDSAIEIRRLEKIQFDTSNSESFTMGHLRMPIIALTAGTVKGERERCLEAGMNDYLTKPIVGDSLLIIMEKWIPLTLRVDDVI
jgi:PAS domain S-box-containing protein